MSLMKTPIDETAGLAGPRGAVRLRLGLSTPYLGADLIHQSLEGLGLVHGEVGQDFPVDLDAGLSEAADKSAVGQVVEATGGVDPLDPESAEIPLLLFAADIVVLKGAV